jgi:CCR4-NOT transcription complex subunit 1
MPTMLAFNVALADLTITADDILARNYDSFLEILSASGADNDAHIKLPDSVTAVVIQQLLQNPFPGFDEDAKAHLHYAIQRRYQRLMRQVPAAVVASWTGTVSNQPLTQFLQRADPACTQSTSACKESLQSAGLSDLDESQVADALVTLIANDLHQQIDLQVLIATIRDGFLRSNFDWDVVVRAFDRKSFKVGPKHFMALLTALIPVANEEPPFDIQQLWGGRWQNAETQLSFLESYLLLKPDRINLVSIPRFRASFTADDFAEAPEAIKQYASDLSGDPLISVEAIGALFYLYSEVRDEVVVDESRRLLDQAIRSNLGLLLCGAFLLPKPWNETQQGILPHLLYQSLGHRDIAFDFSLYFLWKVDRVWVATRLQDAHVQDPLKLPIILEEAERQGWVEALLQMSGGLSMDLAALAHQIGTLDLEQWASTQYQRRPEEFPLNIAKFVHLKAEDEMRIRHEHETPKTIKLAVKTVFGLLKKLQKTMGTVPELREILMTALRLCVQAYPRLISYGGSGDVVDHIIDANGAQSNQISSQVDDKMQEHFKMMYSGELEVKTLVERLQRYKTSNLPLEQDLFACIIHGLFDEYACYKDYPLDALATTAVLFGGIIKHDLISGIPLEVALDMALESVKNNTKEDSMYKFGLQALLQVDDRLTKWPSYCQQLLETQSLRNTDFYSRVEELIRGEPTFSAQARDNVGDNSAALSNGASGHSVLANGDVDGVFNHQAESALVPRFASINVDPPLHPELYEEPDEDVQEKVVFVLNNVSEGNLEDKLKDLKAALEEKHHEWFAGYLVKERAKLQPNHHQLYFNLLSKLGNKTLWAEVLRETYGSCSRALNAEATMKTSAPERTHLQNLASWLGFITIARDKPIKFRNLSFKDLLIEAYDTQRLIVVIPFTCKVLVQAAKSTVFKPPNPWLMDILRLLIEIYHTADMKVNQKFSIEILCRELKLDHLKIEPSTSLRERPIEDDMHISDALDAFDDMSIAAGGLGRQGTRQNDRFSAQALQNSLPDIIPALIYPSVPSSMISASRLKQIIDDAVIRAIMEIISPVVERSVTIAAISTTQLIQKDFAMDGEEEKLQQSARTMVKKLAGSLALVTCKEPLRMSISNNIRQSLAQNPYNEQPLSDGAIQLCVSENLEVACKMVERAAEERSIPEIEDNIEPLVLARRQHHAERPNENYRDGIYNRWSSVLPAPFALTPGGLNGQQMMIYQEFARSHGPSVSSDGSRQPANDSAPEQYPAVPNLPTPAEPPAIPHQAQPPSVHQSLQAQQSASVLPHQMNGFPDFKTIEERVKVR